jgi:hypothetical protein
VIKLFTDLPQWKRAIGLSYTATILAIFARSGSFEVGWQWVWGLPFLLLFLLWCLFPIWMPLIFKPKMVVNGLAVAALAAYSIYIYWQSMFGPDIRSTSGLIFVFLPLYQSAVGVGILLLGWAESLVRGRVDDS